MKKVWPIEVKRATSNKYFRHNIKYQYSDRLEILSIHLRNLIFYHLNIRIIDELRQMSIDSFMTEIF